MSASECTATARLTLGSKPYSPPSDWMLPSKMSPTISPFWLMTGDPELPPMMSLVVQKSNGVFRSSFGLALIHVAGRANGSRPVARSKAPAKLVSGAMKRPFSF